MNANALLAETFVDELARGGVEQVCIAPGSRSTPLTLAFAAHPAIQVYLHLDERSAAFFALGLALANGRPVPVVCTSGSAAANFFPAIVEARMSRVPLLILTADRPHELRHSGANQTIDQVKMYGDQVLWSVDLPVPEVQSPELALRHVRTLAARALAVAGGLEQGPVHLNFPFRKPLELEPGEPPAVYYAPAGTPPATRITRGSLAPTREQLLELKAIMRDQPRGWIVCGPRSPGEPFPEAVAALAQASGYPLLADPLSGVRFAAASGDLAIGGYDTFLAGGEPSFDPPEVVIRLGGVPTSASLTGYLSRIRPQHRILVNEHGVWADDDHRITWFLQADPTLLCQNLAAGLDVAPRSPWAENVYALERATWGAMDQALAGSELFDGAAVAEVLQALPAGARLFMGNSLPVRHLDQFGQPGARAIEVFGCRGASGIDGNVSTALGIAAEDPQRPLVAILGDITLYHDLNGLLAVERQGLRNVTIVLLNNNGGGIFHRLPVSRLEPPFTELFLTPHGLQFEHAARLYGLEYGRVSDRAALRASLERGLPIPGGRLIEVPTDSSQDLLRRKAVMQFIHHSLRTREEA